MDGDRNGRFTSQDNVGRLNGTPLCRAVDKLNAFRERPATGRYLRRSDGSQYLPEYAQPGAAGVKQNIIYRLAIGRAGSADGNADA